MSQPAKILALRLLLSLFIVAGVYIASVSIADYRTAVDAMGWPTAQGSIIRSEIRGGGRRARHRLEYAYHVDGERYVGHRVTLRDGLIKYKTTDRARIYHQGRTVTVYHSPADPAASVLETGLHWPGLVFAAFASLIPMAAGALGLYLTVKRDL